LIQSIADLAASRAGRASLRAVSASFSHASASDAA